MADNGQDILTEDTGEVQSYGELMGKENPPEAADLEPGKVELSIPQKITPDMYPQEEEEVIEAEPEVVSTPVYQEAYVGEDGVELSVPPTYIKDNLPDQTPKYQRPKDMPEFMDDESYAIAEAAGPDASVSAEGDETPDFLHGWTDDAKAQTPLPQEDDFEEPETPAEGSFIAEALAEDNAGEAEKSVFETDGGEGTVLPAGEPEAKDTAADDEDYDLSNIDEIIAAHTPQEENVEVRELSQEDIQGNGSPAVHEAIPRFEPDWDDEEIAETKETEVEGTVASGDGIEEVQAEEVPAAESGAGEVLAEPLTTDEVEEPLGASLNEGEINESLSEEALSSAVVEKEEPQMSVHPVELREEEYAEERQNSPAQFYSGQIDDGYLVVSAENMPEEFQADALVKAIMVNTGDSDYGWSAAFDNGVIMGIADVRRFQLRNGRLPAADGILSYGSKRMRFSGVERIVVYEVPHYFGYK